MNRLKENVEQQEALVDSYNVVIGNQNSLDAEIDKILGGSFSPQVNDKLSELKNNLKISQGTPPPNEQLNLELERLKEQLKKK